MVPALPLVPIDRRPVATKRERLIARCASVKDLVQ
jgi:hypothetical protein